MNIVIVEDELPASEQLRRFVTAYREPVAITGMYSTCSEIVKYLDDNEMVDVIFCDIELRDGNALTALQKINLKTVIVFTTAYDQFWNASLKHNGIDYLLKPLTAKKVHAALDKVVTLKRIFTKDNQILKQLSGILQQNPGAGYRKRFPVRVGSELFVIDAADVIFFRIVNGVVFAVVDEKKKYPLMEETLSALEEQLDPQQFFRVNRSDVVNVRFIKSIRIEEASDYTVLLKNSNEKIPVSQSRISQLKEWFA
ncbi:LytR/AlgR family response regulator transcription factor [Niabella beijingensis]|uniref:LytR/AlgR family response regulator transcription factor n=1 Tax=Niabella beijingensis TaxID=2872700 RepID=UPI001CBB86AB|nr:LytTR family DNA-binding domain-containing protein [Niabella beijingensis]MBZ4189430.1 LytTR family DNA-binding domain-containing protein [Niabella beijingensis]